MINVNYSLSIRLGSLLAEKGLTLAVAESCTGGGLAEEITAVAGSSEYFNRGFIVYSNQAKQDCLNVSSETLECYGAVSVEVAREMAQGLLKYPGVDVGISITGIAGPSGGTVDKPVGTVCFGLALCGGGCQQKKIFFESGRKNIRTCAIGYALQWLLETVS
jgi:nicotinamide-nucleotide amidase